MASDPATLAAADIMTPEPICAERSTSIRQLARLFEDNEISGTPVADEAGRVIGVVSKSDLIRRCSEGTPDTPPAYLFEAIRPGRPRDPYDAAVIPEPLVCVEDFMTADPVTVTPATPVAAVARLMVERRIHRVVVVDEHRFPIGIITSLDLLGVFPREAGARARSQP